MGGEWQDHELWRGRLGAELGVSRGRKTGESSRERDKVKWGGEICNH